METRQGTLLDQVLRRRMTWKVAWRRIVQGCTSTQAKSWKKGSKSGSKINTRPIGILGKPRPSLRTFGEATCKIARCYFCMHKCSKRKRDGQIRRTISRSSKVRIVRSRLFHKLQDVSLFLFKFKTKRTSRFRFMTRDIFVDSNPTRTRTLKRVSERQAIYFEPVRPGPGSESTSSRFWMLAFVWDRFQPIWTSRLRDKPVQHSIAQSVRWELSNLKIRPKPWPNDVESSWIFWNVFYYIY